jgi:hypothetical protein
LTRGGRGLVSLGVALAFIAGGDAARAADARDTKKECVAASEEAQLLGIKKQLVAERAQLLLCARAECPSVVKHDCEGWLAEVDANLPSVVLDAKDSSGHDVGDVRVQVDGRPLVDHLDGKAVSLDVGQHVFRFERSGEVAVEQTVIVHEGEKNRLIVAAFGAVPQAATEGPPAASPAAPPSAPPSPSQASSVSSPLPEGLPASSHWSVPTATWILGGVGLVALGFATFFEVEQLNTYNSDLNNGCGPSGCTDADKQPIQNERIAAGISLGVGVAALAVGAIVLFTSNPQGPKSDSGLRFGVSPTRTGATAAIEATF